LPTTANVNTQLSQRRSQEFDLGGYKLHDIEFGGYKLHDIEFVLGQGDKATTKNLRWTDLGGGYISRYTPRRYAPGCLVSAIMRL